MAMPENSSGCQAWNGFEGRSVLARPATLALLCPDLGSFRCGNVGSNLLGEIANRFESFWAAGRFGLRSAIDLLACIHANWFPSLEFFIIAQLNETGKIIGFFRRYRKKIFGRLSGLCR
jgi:hypothetical protein